MKLEELLPMSPMQGPPLPRALNIRWPFAGKGEINEKDMLIGAMMGAGGIPLHGRENRKEPCHGCRIDPSKPFGPDNGMFNSANILGTLSKEEARNWCSELIEEKDGRCARAWAMHQAAKECKELHPHDTKAYFECFVPKFSAATRR